MNQQGSLESGAMRKLAVAVASLTLADVAHQLRVSPQSALAWPEFEIN